MGTPGAVSCRTCAGDAGGVSTPTDGFCLDSSPDLAESPAKGGGGLSNTTPPYNSPGDVPYYEHWLMDALDPCREEEEEAGFASPAFPSMSQIYESSMLHRTPHGSLFVPKGSRAPQYRRPSTQKTPSAPRPFPAAPPSFAFEPLATDLLGGGYNGKRKAEASPPPSVSAPPPAQSWAAGFASAFGYPTRYPPKSRKVEGDASVHDVRRKKM